MPPAHQLRFAKAPRPGDRVGPYRLGAPLGEGGVALVFRGTHEQTGAVVAIKTVRAPRERLLASVRREIQSLKRIQHPGVISILEGGVEDGRPWYAMELLEGATLRKYLGIPASTRISATVSVISGQSETRLGATEDHTTGETPRHSAPPSLRSRVGRVPWLLGLVRELCEPLAFIHGEGIVHRDLTPSNVFVRSDGRPVLMDFGLVWQLTDESREVLSVDMVQAGTISYMAPEQARGERLDARADLFALGCILYEVLTGDVPYPVSSWRELIDAHDGPQPLPPSAVADGVPPGLDDLVLGLLRRHPRDRIGHASDVAAALADLGASDTRTYAAPRAKAYLYRPELVGRSEPLRQALVSVAALLRGEGGLMLVSGTSGIGKTTFVSELARQVQLAQHAVVVGQCVAVGVAGGRGLRQGGPLYPLAPLLQAVGDRCVSGDRERTDRLLGPRGKILATVEPWLRSLSALAPYPDPPEIPGEAARRRLIDALAETLSAFAAEQSTLLVLEDIQWADDLTLAFLSSLSARFYRDNPVLIVATVRSEEVGPALDHLFASPQTSTVRLSRLDTTAVEEMGAEMLGQKLLPPGLAVLLAAESSGNPFFVAEYLRAAVDARLLFRDERGRWQPEAGRSFEALGLPRTLESLVLRRIEDLAGVARTSGGSCFGAGAAGGARCPDKARAKRQRPRWRGQPGGGAGAAAPA